MKTNLLITNITKSYPGSVQANNNVSLSFKPGEITAILGHNGAGKSTLLNQIIGNVLPDSGDISYGGLSFIDKPNKARELVSMMPQFQTPLTGVKLKEAVEAIWNIRCTKNCKKSQVNQVIEDLDLSKWQNYQGDDLSGGVQRLTSFAMAVVCPAPIYLFDEPTNDVDPYRRKLVWEYMKKLARVGHIVVVVTHNLLEVQEYADHFIIMKNGQVILDKSVSSIFDQDRIHLLSVDLLDKCNSIENLNCIKYKKKDSKVEFYLTDEQLAGATEWALNQLNDKKILNYKLSQLGIASYYEEVDNE